ncbi:MAG: response regulator [Comamonadaceae bacterium]|nr:MAG: response regulator [Comamonadaceae bacterium]
MPPEILIIDDNQDATELLRELLEMQDFSVRTALTGAQALAHMRERPAQILLVDQNLPDMTGSTLAPQLRAIAREQAGLPCVAIAITGMGSGAQAGLEGFDHILGKPLDFDAFDALLQKTIAQLQTARS